jgi:RNA polymerase sigma-70 factor (ECF subfamily)
MVYRHCLQLMGQQADAQDAAQETMLRAFRAMPRFIGQSGIATWLYRIAHNTCLDMLKKPQRKRESSSMEQLREAGFEPQAPGDTPDVAYEKNAEAGRLSAAINRLPRDQQVLLNLRYGENYSYEELAKATGLRVGTVKSKLSRAKDRLQELMKA